MQIILSGREKDLIKRGYSTEDVLKFSRTSEQEIKTAAEKIFADLTKDVHPSEDPVCVYIGSQPGCGKSTLIRQIKAGRLGPEFADLAMDDYRSFHPRYAELETLIEEHWEGRDETPDDSPGSDIADFTQHFAGATVDLLEEMVTSGVNKYNILYEWAMRSPAGPLVSMRRLKEKGYGISVNFIAVNKTVSLDACRRRSVIMNSKGRIIRAIPDCFHRLSVELIPASCNEIFRQGADIIDSFVITDRAGNIIWQKGDKGLPGDILKEILDNGPADIQNIVHFAEDAFEHEARGFRTRAN